MPNVLDFGTIIEEYYETRDYGNQSKILGVK